MRKQLLVSAVMASLIPLELAAGRFMENPVQHSVRVHKGPKSAMSPRQERKARKAEKRAAALAAILSEAAQRAQAQKGQA